MSGRNIEEVVKRRLYAESMGRCMNPDCKKELFSKNGDIIEKAHIDPYCETADNTFENLVVLCPNCHTEYDKNRAFKPEEILSWKRKRKEELDKFFSKKYDTFDELKAEIVPILTENKIIYEKYYLNENKKLWEKFENSILINNKKIEMLLLANLHLIQKHEEKAYSNLALVQSFIAHIDEFEKTRLDEEKSREILFPAEINSMFGIVPLEDAFLSSTESLELLIKKLKIQGKFETVALGLEHPYIKIIENGKAETVFLDDTPRIRQLYYNNNCFRSAKVRLESLNFALKYINDRHIKYRFISDDNLREIEINDSKLIFVYEYCLSNMYLRNLMPDPGTIIVNLHNWNGESCISKEAYDLSVKMEVELLTMDAFYDYIKRNK